VEGKVGRTSSARHRRISYQYQRGRDEGEGGEERTAPNTSKGSPKYRTKLLRSLVFKLVGFCLQPEREERSGEAESERCQKGGGGRERPVGKRKGQTKVSKQGSVKEANQGQTLSEQTELRNQHEGLKGEG
jgi:hypothetical protein